MMKFELWLRERERWGGSMLPMDFRIQIFLGCVGRFLSGVTFLVSFVGKVRFEQSEAGICLVLDG